MVDDEARKGEEGTPAGGAARSSGIPAWAVAVATFVVGLLLGGVVVALATGDSDRAPAQAAPSTSPSPSPSPGRTPVGTDVLVRVPGSCLQVADQAEVAVQGVDQLAAAVRDFDARKLQELIDRFQQLRPQVEALAEQCRDAAGRGLADGDLVRPAPTTTPS